MRVKLLTTALSLSILFACTTANTTTKPEPSKTPVITSTSSPNPSSSASIIPSVSPTASVTPVVSKYKYSFPLKVTGKFECDNNAPAKVFYELKDKTLSYNLNFETLAEKVENDIQTKTLSDDELKDFNNLLSTLDISKLAEKDEKVPPNSPQTEECRTINGITLLVDNKETTLFRNDRQLIHTQEYRDAYDKIIKKLEALKESNMKQADLNKNFEAKIGETFNVKIENDSLILKVDSKVEDSRCPMNARCIQAGKVTFKLVSYNYGSKNEFNLSLDPAKAEASKSEAGGFKFTLVGVTPESFETTNVPKDSDYKLTIKVEKL